MEYGNVKSGDCETSVAGSITCAGAESPEAPCGLDRHIEMRAIEALKPSKTNARSHSKQQLEQIARSIDRFGFVNPVLIDEANQIIAGHGRVEAAKRLGLDHVPVLRVTHLSTAERKAYALADNRLAELAGWDAEILAIELQELRELDFDIAAIGFELDDVDIVCNETEKTGNQIVRKTDRGPRTSGRLVSGAGDVWLLGPHQLRCGDAGDDASYAPIDGAIQHWQRVAGQSATLADSGKSFAAIAKERASSAQRGSRASAKREAA
jgi:ParB-like nuclease domain